MASCMKFYAMVVKFLPPYWLDGPRRLQMACITSILRKLYTGT